jgi:hypothetical protein
VVGLRFQQVRGFDSTISSWEAAQQLKTEYSQDEVPIERGFILELKKWQGALGVRRQAFFPVNDN